MDSERRSRLGSGVVFRTLVEFGGESKLGHVMSIGYTITGRPGNCRGTSVELSLNATVPYAEIFVENDEHRVIR